MIKPALLLSLLWFLVAIPASAQRFPLPVTPERAVSAAAVTPIIPARQDIGIASSAHGYAVVWDETATDYSSRGFVRRFSAAGTPLDDQPVPVVTLLSTPFDLYEAAITLAATDSTYILGWRQPMVAGSLVFVFRRMDAASGAWIDAQPVPLGQAGSVHLASNGDGFLAVFTAACGANTCLEARGINPTGSPLTSPEWLLRIPDDHNISEVIVGSNGTDYLAAWTEEPVCHSTDLCGGPPPAQVYALRLHADGTPIDGAPLVLDTGNRPAFGLTVAWSGGRYLLAWSTAGTIVGTRITDDGAVLDRDHGSGGAVLLAPMPAGVSFSSPLVAGLDDRFVLIMRHDIEDLLKHIDQTYVEGVSFNADADLTNVATLPRTPLFAIDDHLGRSLFATANGTTLAIAYNRGMPEVGTVTRVFLRLFSESAPRRRVAH